MRWFIGSTLITFLVIGSVNSQTTPAPQNDIGQRVQHLMNVEVGFEEMVPPGTSIHAKEVSRRGKSGKDLIVQYHIFVAGVAPDTLFNYIDWPVNAENPSVRLEGISVGKDGVLICAGRTAEECGDPKNPDDPIEFTSIPLKGEPSRLAFISSNVKIGIVIVPDPVEATDNGCALTAKRLTRPFDLAFISGTGYPPNADIHYKVSSEMVGVFIVKSNGSGAIRVSVIPFPGKKKEGIATVKIMESKCSPEISWEWGPM